MIVRSFFYFILYRVCSSFFQNLFVFLLRERERERNASSFLLAREPQLLNQLRSPSLQAEKGSQLLFQAPESTRSKLKQPLSFPARRCLSRCCLRRHRRRSLLSTVRSPSSLSAWRSPSSLSFSLIPALANIYWELLRRRATRALRRRSSRLSSSSPRNAARFRRPTPVVVAEALSKKAGIRFPPGGPSQTAPHLG